MYPAAFSMVFEYPLDAVNECSSSIAKTIQPA